MLIEKVKGLSELEVGWLDDDVVILDEDFWPTVLSIIVVPATSGELEQAQNKVVQNVNSCIVFFIFILSSLNL